MRLALCTLILLGSAAAALADTCPAKRTVYTREGDGAVFKVLRYGKREDRWPSWFVYEGLFRGRVAYLARGSMTGGRSGISTSVFVPPAEIEQWGQDTEGFVPELFIFDGPLWGYWKGKCEVPPLRKRAAVDFTGRSVPNELGDLTRRV